MSPWEIVSRLAIVFLLLVILYQRKRENSLSKDKDWLSLFGIELMVAGGLSNLLDLLTQAGVVDVLKTPLFYFNGADVLVIVGALLVFLKLGTAKLSTR